MLSTFEDLEDSGCIKINEDRVEPTMLGSTAAQYYLKYTTVSMFGSNIGADTSLEVSEVPQKIDLPSFLAVNSFSKASDKYLLVIAVLLYSCHRFSSTYCLVLLNMMSFLYGIMK